MRQCLGWGTWTGWGALPAQVGDGEMLSPILTGQMCSSSFLRRLSHILQPRFFHTLHPPCSRAAVSPVAVLAGCCHGQTRADSQQEPACPPAKWQKPDPLPSSSASRLAADDCRRRRGTICSKPNVSARNIELVTSGWPGFSPSLCWGRQLGAPWGGTFAGSKHRADLDGLQAILAHSPWALSLCCAENVGWKLLV